LKSEIIRGLAWAQSIGSIMGSSIAFEYAACLPALAWACHDSPLMQEQVVSGTPLLKSICDGIARRPDIFSTQHVVGMLKCISESGNEKLVVQMLDCGAVGAVSALVKVVDTAGWATVESGAGRQPLVQVTAGFLKALAFAESARTLVVGASMVEFFLDVLDAVSAVDDAEANRQCLAITELMLERELSALATMKRQDAMLDRASAQQADAMVERKVNLSHLAAAGEKMATVARNSFLAVANANGASYLAIERAEDHAAENMATAAAVKTSLQVRQLQSTRAYDMSPQHFINVRVLCRRYMTRRQSARHNRLAASQPSSSGAVPLPR
jgi:hypothetical protein